MTQREKSAGAVIFRKEKGRIKYLLLHYELGHWDFPKGHIEKNETPKEAAKREIKEETGIEKLEFLDGFRYVLKYFFKREGKLVFKTVIFFLAKTTTKKVKLSFEHIGFKWLSFENALKQLTFKNAKELLKKANEFISKKGI